MSDILSILKNKADLLQRKLRSYGMKIDSKSKLDFFARIMGEKYWEDLVRKDAKGLLHFTACSLCPKRLNAFTGIPYASTRAIVAAIDLSPEYVPCFNTVNLQQNDGLTIPRLFLNSNLFSVCRRRSQCLLQRIYVTSDQNDLVEHEVWYSGGSLNMYDRRVFFTLLELHPLEVALGRYFAITTSKVMNLWGRTFSMKSFEASLGRMQDCRIWTPYNNFHGPLIDRWFKIPHTKGYRVAMNPELAKSYYDPMYAVIMDKGNLFHYKLTHEQKLNIQDFKKLMKNIFRMKKAGQDCDTEQLESLWPIHQSDFYAIMAIIIKNFRGNTSTIELKLIEECILSGEMIEIKLPEWKIEVFKYFTDLYGENEGKIFFNKTLSAFLKPIFSIGQEGAEEGV